MTKHTTSTSDAIKKLQDKDGEANNESARTNEILASREAASDVDPVKASLALNDPSLSRSAYTSHESGFNEDLEPKEVEVSPAKGSDQTHAVNK